MNTYLKSVIFYLCIIFFTLLFPMSFLYAQTQSFTFGDWADTKSGLSTLNALSKQMASKTPVFIFYPGDVCSSGPTTGCLDTWKSNYNSGGDLYSISFPSRGNHDASGTSVWVSYFNIPAVVTKVGATNYSTLSANLTYSFDYASAHFVVVDMPGGDSTSMSSGQLTWVDSDLSAAEARGVVHSFLFWHGPEYPMDGHCCTNNPNIPALINNHPSVSATFHGHEHILAYSHIDASKFSNVTHPYEEFIIGAAGAELYDCQRGDWCLKSNGLATVTVSGLNFTVNVFNESGSLLKNWTFTKTNTNISSPTVKPTITPQKKTGDANGDNSVNGADFIIWLNHYGQNATGFAVGDFNNSGKVDGADFVVWLNNYGR